MMSIRAAVKFRIFWWTKKGLSSMLSFGGVGKSQAHRRILSVKICVGGRMISHLLFPQDTWMRFESAGISCLSSFILVFTHIFM